MTTRPIPTAFLSASLPYVNAEPHLGFAFELVQADALGRYRRLTGWDVHRQTGTDDNSLKNVKAADLAGISTQAWVERHARRFFDLQPLLDLDFNAFVRTSGNAQHARAVDALWTRCAKRGDVYKKAYAGSYCVECEQFYRKGELVDGVCPTHGTRPELVAEENHFFRLSRYAPRLHELIASNELRILPEQRRNEVLRFIEAGLDDFSISRSYQRARGWGIPVPGDPAQVVYVWFDALANYVSALGYHDARSGAADNDAGYERYWKHATSITHVIGKDILRFHAVYWPAILLSAGVRLPTEILVHGYITVEGRKIGKSAGNSVDPFAVVDQYGIDPVRYYLLRHLHSTHDGDFSRDRLIAAYNGELADQLGNLVQRVTSLIARYRGGVVPQVRSPGEHALAAHIRDTAALVEKSVDGFALHDALGSIWRLIAVANRHVERTAPWKLAKTSTAAATEQLDGTLYALADTVAAVALLLWPFLPRASTEIARRLGTSLPTTTCVRPGALTCRARIHTGPPLFPK